MFARAADQNTLQVLFHVLCLYGGSLEAVNI